MSAFWRSIAGSVRHRRNRSKPIYEEVIIYDDDRRQIYRVALPISVIAEKIDANARYVPNTMTPRYVGAASGLAISWIVMSTALLFALQWPIVAAIIMSSALAGFGMLPGWLLGARFGPRPQWIVRLADGDFTAMPIEGYGGNDHPDASFVSEIREQRDLKYIYRGGQSKTQKLILGSLIMIFGCLVVAFFFMIIVFTGA